MKTEDIAYRTVEGQTLLGRLYRPEGPSEVLVVEVHGGAWRTNDRTSNAAIHEHLAADGCAVFALDFRLAPAHRYPAALNDTNYGIRWIKANAARLGLAPRLVGGVATSSGAQQLVTNALRPDFTRYVTHEPTLAGHSARLDLVVACWPILDPLARYRMAQEKGLQNLVDAHHAFFAGEPEMAQANPQLIVERGEAVSLPPMLVLQGTADQNVEHQRADLFAERYRAAGGEIELVKFDGQPHTFIPNDPGSAASREALERIARFIRRRLEKESVHV